MSPEQMEANDVDHRSDIYSLGLILYEMSTGKAPFEGDTPVSIAMKHKTEKPRDPREINPQIPEELGRLILKCMEKERERRYETADEIYAVLSEIEKDMASTGGAVPRIQAESGTWIKRPRTVLVLGVVVLAVALITVGFILFDGNSPSRCLIRGFEGNGFGGPLNSRLPVDGFIHLDPVGSIPSVQIQIIILVRATVFEAVPCSPVVPAQKYSKGLIGADWEA